MGGLHLCTRIKQKMTGAPGRGFRMLWCLFLLSMRFKNLTAVSCFLLIVISVKS